MDTRDPSSTLGGEPGILDRARGALLGAAVGDALGSTLEFSPRIARIADYHREMKGGGPFNLPVGAWTDDTALSLALSKSLLICGKFDPHDTASRFLAYYRKGEYSSTGTCVDIGITTRQALERFERTGDPFSGLTDERSFGNGSIMRLAPVALFGLDDEAEAVRIAREQSQLTHASEVCLSANDYLVRLLRLFILGERDPLKLALVGWSGHPEVVRAKAAFWNGLSRKDVRSTGYVIDTLEAALWAVEGSGTFEQALVSAVSLGGDADSVGAVAGALAGAKWDESAIPKRWLDVLAWRNRIAATAMSLVRVSSEAHSS